ncbi:MAG: YbhB/YbcL family Raf kinase inhibitor-like protein [bacterium]
MTRLVFFLFTIAICALVFIGCTQSISNLPATTTTTSEPAGSVSTTTSTSSPGSTSSSTTTTTTTTSSTTTVTLGSVPNSMTLNTDGFSEGGYISTLFAYTEITGGQNSSPGISWESEPAETQSFVFTMRDTSMEAELGEAVYHWVVINIPTSVTSIEDTASATTDSYKGATMPVGCVEIKNNVSNLVGYEGPWPPTGEKHLYTFTLYALNTDSVSLEANTVISEALFGNAVYPYVLDYDEVHAWYDENAGY